MKKSCSVQHPGKSDFDQPFVQCGVLVNRSELLEY